MPAFRRARRADYLPLKGDYPGRFNLLECFVKQQRDNAEMPFRRNTDGSGLGSRDPLFHGSDPMIFDFNNVLDNLPNTQKQHGEKLRRHLQFFFLDPVNKFRLRRQFPFKLALQILKVVLVSVQLILFADLRISHVDFMDDTVTVMRHKFLKDWDHERDSVTYPPEAGRYSVFTSDELYYSLQNESFASFSYDTVRAMPDGAAVFKARDQDFTHIPPLKLCVKRLANVKIENHTYIFDISEQTDCHKLNITEQAVSEIRANPLAIRDYFQTVNMTFKPEDALIIQQATVSFNLRTIHFSPGSMDQKPECYLIEINIRFDNTRHTGQVFIYLDALIKYVNLCNGRVLQVDAISTDALIVGILDVLVLSTCSFSLLLCCRALFRAQRLKSMTADFFESVFHQKLSLKDELSFLNMWYVMIVVNDVCIVTGTVCKIAVEFRDFDNSVFTMTGVLLGVGCLLVYIGLFRYLGFFNQYNVLILTLKRALPSIGRFMICTIILYVGFLIAGWVIIGPYSIKFRTLTQSSEALFSLMNGDDMFATFYTINDSNSTIKLIGTLYIYLFVCLFIYVVLSLFIAIIMDAYEVVREKCNRGVVVEKSSLQEFLASAEIPQDLDSGETRDLFRPERLVRLDDSISRAWARFLLFCRELRTGGEVDYSDLDRRHNPSPNNDSNMSLHNLDR